MTTHRIDVRALPTWLRHREIFASFDALHIGETLMLMTDHEPRPLRYEFDRQREGRFVWIQHQYGNDEWQVTIRRVAGEGPQASLADFFARCALLEGAIEATKQAFVAAGVERTLTRREALCEQGVEWPYLGFVREGTIGQISESAGGRERLLFEYLPFETFGEIALVDGGTALGRVLPPFGQARIVAIPRKVVLAHVNRDPALAHSLLLLCAQRGRALAERLDMLTGQSITGRIAHALLPYAPPDKGLAPALAPATQMSQSQLAIAAGTVREVAARALFELESAGAIELEAGRVRRIDRAKLSTFL